MEEDRILLVIAAYVSLQGRMEEVIAEYILSKLKSTQLAEQGEHMIRELARPPAIAAEPAVERIGIEYSFPDWIVQKLVEQYGESEAEKICSSLNEQAPLTLRVNTLKTTVERCQDEMGKLGISTTKTVLSPLGLNLSKRINIFSLPLFRDGWFEVQDEGSQLLPLLVDPKPNVKLLDVCAGAGGKTLEFAALMKNRGEIFASDINSYRLEELRKRVKRSGAQNIRIQEIQAIDDLIERYSGFFDIVFVDAPCSGLGTIRRNPGMKWMVTEHAVNELSEKQTSILSSSAPLVKSGGRMVYATCTLLRQENEDVVEAFVKNHPEFKVLHESEILETGNKEEATQGSFFKLLPHINGTDGFFCAVLEKQAVR